MCLLHGINRQVISHFIQVRSKGSCKGCSDFRRSMSKRGWNLMESLAEFPHFFLCHHIGGIAAEKFISGIPAECHGNMFSGHLAHQHGGNLGGICKRFREAVCHVLHDGKGILAGHIKFRMLRTQMSCNFFCIFRLIILIHIKADGKGFHFIMGKGLHQTHHQ